MIHEPQSDCHPFTSTEQPSEPQQPQPLAPPTEGGASSGDATLAVTPTGVVPSQPEPIGTNIQFNASPCKVCKKPGGNYAHFRHGSTPQCTDFYDAANHEHHDYEPEQPSEPQSDYAALADELEQFVEAHDALLLSWEPLLRRAIAALRGKR